MLVTTSDCHFCDHAHEVLDELGLDPREVDVGCFLALGLLLSLPMLRRLHHRFGTPVAPGLAIVAFAVVFIFSSLVIAPRRTGSEQTKQPGIEQPAGSDHASHHPGGGK